MSDMNKVLLEGYEFKLTGFVYAEGITTVTICVTGNKNNVSDLQSWVLEICPDDVLGEIDIVSCEKRICHSAWLPAIAQKTTYELSGDIGISGVVIEEWEESDNAAMEFRIAFDAKLSPWSASIVCISHDTIYRSIEKILIGSQPTSTPRWSTPIEKPFCLYMVIPEGYKPVGACKANVSIIRKGVFTTYEQEPVDVDKVCASDEEITIKTNIQGSVKIIASVPMKSHKACGDTIEISVCDCFDINETIGATSKDKKIQMRDISICPKKQSFDLTLLNAHCGKSVYRLDGKYTIDCKHCE